jgi:phage internal scaffolding protein
MNKPAVPFIRSVYNYDRDVASDEAALVIEGESKTVQSQAEDADINTIVKRFGITGVLPENVRTPTYGDFVQIDDYRTAVHVVMDAEREFLKIPAGLRARFENDPQQWIDFVMNPDNVDEAVKLGFVVKREVDNGSDSKVVGGASEASASGDS